MSDEFDRQTSEALEDTVRSTLGGDLPDGLSFGVRLSGPPRGDWTRFIEPRFKVGDLVLHVKFDDDCEEDIYAMKVSGLGTQPDTYNIKSSGSRDDHLMDGKELKLAPDDAKWESYYEANDPLSIPGLKVSCPSNEKFKKPSK